MDNHTRLSKWGIDDIFIVLFIFCCIFTGGIFCGIILHECDNPTVCIDEIYPLCLKECNDWCGVEIVRVSYMKINGSANNTYQCNCISKKGVLEAGLIIKYDI